MMPEKWLGDTPDEDKKRIEESLERVTESAGDLEDEISRSYVGTDSLRQNAKVLNEYIEEKKSEENPDQNLLNILKKITRLFADEVQLDEIHARNVMVSMEKGNPGFWKDLLKLEEYPDAVNITSFNPKPGVDKDMIHNLYEKKRAIDKEFHELADVVKHQYPKEYEILEKRFAARSENREN